MMEIVIDAKLSTVLCYALFLTPYPKNEIFLIHLLMQRTLKKSL